MVREFPLSHWFFLKPMVQGEIMPVSLRNLIFVWLEARMQQYFVKGEKYSPIPSRTRKPGYVSGYVWKKRMRLLSLWWWHQRLARVLDMENHRLSYPRIKWQWNHQSKWPSHLLPKETATACATELRTNLNFPQTGQLPRDGENWAKSWKLGKLPLSSRAALHIVLRIIF